MLTSSCATISEQLSLSSTIHPSIYMIFFVTSKFFIVSVLAGRVVTAITPLTFQIHFNSGNKNKCPDVRGAVVENNTRVNMSAIISYANWLINFFLRYDYNGTLTQWIFNGSTKVRTIRLAGTIFCLDTGTCTYLVSFLARSMNSK